MEQVDNANFFVEVKRNLKKRKLSVAWAASQLGMTAHHLGQVMLGKKPLSDEVREELSNLNIRIVESFEEVQAG